MAQESSNGSPGESTDDDGPSDGTEFERFERLTRHLVSISKEDVEREAEREKHPAKSKS